jgi:hypothetical protein
VVKILEYLALLGHEDARTSGCDHAARLGVLDRRQIADCLIQRGEIIALPLGRDLPTAADCLGEQEW